eukprot:gnl/Chilomastix_caulleri/689.p1 GENE.gnl/Chilomastix_caulleri/689~~gnl/Chilomastix_caulleri/689.p1  ORF type:complete len:207 (+),score=72.28 gnl/Chilomastix_caulleri/689:363-983(+)
MDTAVVAAFSNSGCPKPIGFICENGEDMTTTQRYPSAPLGDTIKKLVIHTGDNIKAKYSFNLLKYSINNLVVRGDFAELNIYNANIGWLDIVGTSPKGTNGTDVFNKVTIKNSAVEKLTIDKVGSASLGNNYFGTSSINAGSVKLEAFSLPRPYGILGDVICTGKLSHNGQSQQVTGKTVKFQAEGSTGSPSTITIVADDITINEL